MTVEQFKEGLDYAVDNWKNESAPHLHVDKKLIRQRFDLTGKKILDFGCGMGGMSLWYATNWPCHVHGIDIDGHHIDVALHLREKHGVTNVSFEKKDILESPLQDQYDLIFMNDVAEHIPLDILENILQELNNSLVPGGSLFVTYPPWRSPYASHLNHVIKIPWIQFFPTSFTERQIEKHNHALVGDLEADLKSAYHGLNHLTHKKLITLAEKAGFRQVYRKSHSFVNKFPPLKNLNLRVFPFDFLITKEFLELKRR